MAKLSCRAKTKFIATRNPQANAITEDSHQALADLCHTFKLENNCMDEINEWAGILSATAFAMRSSIHTTLNATPGQLVFGHGMILNLQHQVDWQAIKWHKQTVINKNNLKENSKRIPHTHGVGDKCLLEKDASGCKLNNKGPCKVVAVNNNGTLSCKKGIELDSVNTRCCVPHCEKKEGT